jgi:glutamate dehydrogenase/leucine dehydrogenase
VLPEHTRGILDKEKVFEELTQYMDDAFQAVDKMKEEKGVSYRQAALMIALKRIIQ